MSSWPRKPIRVEARPKTKTQVLGIYKTNLGEGDKERLNVQEKERASRREKGECIQRLNVVWWSTSLVVNLM